MTLIRGYIASTLDGFIAEADGSYGFLDPYPAEDADYEHFYAGIGTVVMGRGTYDAVRRGPHWTYGGRRSIVVTSRPVTDLPPDTEVWTAGLDALVAELRAATRPGDVWILGGGRLQQAFLDRGALDRLEVFIVPVLLGAGIPLFPGAARRQTLRLAHVGRFGAIAHLVFERP